MNFNKNEEINKLEIYNNLMEKYITTINNLIDTSYSMGILPFKIILGINYIKNYLNENRFETLQYGINYILSNKEIILNFDINNLDELDIDSDDNQSIKSCINNLKNHNQNISSTQDLTLNNIFNLNHILSPDNMINLIIEIKNNTKKISELDILIIKNFFELLIIILEKIKNIFL